MNDQTLKQIQEDAARQAILDAARKIIVKSGLDSLSMRGLAKQVGCSPATIYKYFENKDDILEAIRQEGWRLMNEIDIDGGGDQPDLPIEQRLEVLSKIFQAFPHRYPEHYLLMFGSIDAAPMTVEQVLNDEGHQALTALVQHSMAAGELKSEPYTARELALLIWFVSHGVAMLRLTIFREDEKFPQLADQVMFSFAKSLLSPSE